MVAQVYVNPLKAKQLKEYGEDGLKYLQDTKLLSKYVARKASGSAPAIQSRLNRFALFAFKEYSDITSFDAFLAEVKNGKPDAYELLSDFAAWLSSQGYKPNQLRQLVRTAKKFLRSRIVGADIDNDDFRDNVDLPRQEFPEFEGTEISQIRELLRACKNQRLKTALMLYASMGLRAIEGCAIRRMDIDYDKETITIRKEFAKMGKERTRPMTQEMKAQLQLWESIKYQPHQHVGKDRKRVWVTPTPKPDDLVLAFWHMEKAPKPSGIYDSLFDEFEALSNLMQMKRKNGRRVITFHRLRAFCRTAFSNLGQGDFGNWWIGHTKDTYFRNSSKATMEIFKKCEPQLTFLDIASMEMEDATTQAKLDEQMRMNTNLQQQIAKMQQDNNKRFALIAKYLSKDPNLGKLRGEVLANLEIEDT